MVILSLCNTIAITGDSGSGKTTISNILKDILKDSFLLECDRYHKWERHDKNWQNYTHLNPQANYITKMCDDVFDLKIGNEIYQIDYDHETGNFTDKRLIEPKDNIIICGLHCLYMPDNIINLKIYMDTDDNLRIPWKINRDVKKRGYSIEKICNQIKEREHDYFKYIKPQKEKADVIVRFYTDVQFDYDKHHCDMEYPVFLKIGIKSGNNLNKICDFDEIKDIEHLDDYIYINFIFFENYDNIIKKTIKEILLNL
jgi:uridine kinase